MAALSRVNPLPQVMCSPQASCNSCGSGFTREEASQKKAPDDAGAEKAAE
ncbi:hypothetical protein RK21_01988 [Pseudomonas plecoglossicida]|nr:hypothetical protein RK21_01988 [Pseudomonas plecoglossicida]